MCAFDHYPLLQRLMGVLVTAVVLESCRANPPAPESEITTWSMCFRELPVCSVQTHFGTKKVWLAAPQIREAEEGVLEIHGHLAVLAYEFARIHKSSEFTGVEARLTLPQGGGGACDDDGPQEAGTLRATPRFLPRGILGLSVRPLGLVLLDSPPDFMVRFGDETPLAAGCDAPRTDQTISTWSAVQKIVDSPDVKTTLWLAAPALTRGEDGVIDVGGEFLVVTYGLEWKSSAEKPSRVRFLTSSDEAGSWIQHDFDNTYYYGGAFRLSSKDSPPGAVAIAVVRGDAGEKPKWPGDFLIRFRK